MLKTFTVNVSPDSFIANNKSIKDVGEIYIQLNDYAFPGKAWTDFGFNIVFWWMERFIKLLKGEAKSIQCKFMDGNYRFDVSAFNASRWNFKFIAERETDEVWQEGEVDVTQAVQSLLSVIKIMISFRERENDSEKVKYWRLAENELIELIKNTSNKHE